MQLNILYTVTQPPGGCIIESVYFDWHISFFFSSRHYCCKWYLCSIWIFSSKKLVRYLDKYLLNKFFYYYVDDFWKQSNNNAIPTQHHVKSSKQICITLVYQTAQRWDFQIFSPMENSSKNSKAFKKRADILFFYPSFFCKQNFTSPKINWWLLAKGEIYLIQAQNNIPFT